MSGTNDFLLFSPTDTGTNLLSQVAYAADAQRLIGNQPGIARSPLVNKAIRQSAAIAAAIAQLVADITNQNVVDDGTLTTIEKNLLRTLLTSGYAVDTGTVNAFIITLVPAPLALAAGMRFSFIATNANTGAATLVVNGSAAIPIKKNGTDALSANDIPIGSVVNVMYDGTNMQLAASPATGATGGGGDKVFYENGQTVNNDYTITSNTNAMSTGPITIAATKTVTVPTGSVWVII